MASGQANHSDDLVAQAGRHLQALAEARPRRRVDQACTECSKHHRKCDRREGQASCARCLKAGIQCIFTVRNGLAQSPEPERDSDTSLSPQSPTYSHFPYPSSSTSASVHAQPGPSTQQQQPYTQHQPYAYSYNTPAPAVPTTSQIDPRSAPYHPHQNPTVSPALGRGMGPMINANPSGPQYQHPDTLTPYTYSSASYSSVPTGYSSAGGWQSRGTMQQQPAPSSSPPGTSSYLNQGVYSAPSQPPPQPYAGWNPTTSSQYAQPSPQSDYNNRMMGGSNQQGSSNAPFSSHPLNRGPPM